MKLPVNKRLPLAALTILLALGSQAGAKERPAPPPPANGPQADYPMVLGQPFAVDGVTYTPVDTMNYDAVGYAVAGNDGGTAITGSHRTLPLPSYVEVTALDTGRTILVRMERRGPMTGALLTELSPGAAAQLGIAGQPRTAVRVRRVNPPEPERSALRSGQPAMLRMDTPPSLRAVLVRRLEQQGVGAQVSRPGPMLTPDKLPPAPAAIQKPEPKPEPKPEVVSTPVSTAKPAAPIKPAKAEPAPAAKGTWLVQIGAFSSKERASAVAGKAGAKVQQLGKLFRVRMGPYVSRTEADAALAKARAAGYTDARIQRTD
jgi:rare lipoprotein A